MCVAEEVFGEGDHIGVLVRDRFPGYDNSFKGKRQHCFEHLKRDCKELLEKEPQNAEYQKFVPAFVSLLREAMQLRGRGLEDGDYYDEAKRIKNEMLKMINAQAKDPGLQKCQDIFRWHPESIFQWAENRSVPAENNMSERGVRRTVIARKVCMRWTRASASPTCSSRCRHTRQNSVGDGRAPVAFRKSGEKPHMPIRQWVHPESRLRLRTRRLEKLRCTFAQMLRCRGRSRPR